MVKYLAEARGFDRVQISRLHPYPDWDQLPQGADEQLRSRLNTILYGAQDYAVIAYRP